MSCNGCRVLRKGCSESCILRPCLQWIETAESQGHATVFVAKFFGRAGLMSFISSVPESQRPALFQSLLFEACGRTVNPVNGAVGLLWTGNWHVCQAAVETVLRGGTLRPMSDFLAPARVAPASDENSGSEITCSDIWKLQESPKLSSSCRFTTSRSKVSPKRKRTEELRPSDLDLCLTPSFTGKREPEIKWPETPMNSEDSSGVTTSFDSVYRDRCGGGGGGGGGKKQMLDLFV